MSTTLIAIPAPQDPNDAPDTASDGVELTATWSADVRPTATWAVRPKRAIQAVAPAGESVSEG